MQERSQELEKQIDAMIDRIVAAQQPDGYLYTFYTANHQLDKAFTDEKDMHETYCAGQLIEAGLAYFQATNKRTLLDEAIKCAIHLNIVFGPGKKADAPGHEEIELALLKLYGETHQPKYLKLAQFFIDQRGHTENRASNGDYDQDRIPVVDQREIAGHAVRAMYLYSAVTSLELFTGKTQYDTALDSIWRDVVDRKMYITGGIGPSASNEGFTTPYDLPNETAYAETCAPSAWDCGAIGWDDCAAMHSMPMSWNAACTTAPSAASPWTAPSFSTPIRLPAMASIIARIGSIALLSTECWQRYIASVGGRVFAHTDDAIYVNQLFASEATIQLKSTDVTIIQTTKMPWDGLDRIFVSPVREAQFTLNLRIPDWCADCSVTINGDPVDRINDSHGYAVIQRKWMPGDVVEMKMAMPIKRVYADPHVKADVGRVALRRGPIVFCLEAADNPGIDLKNLVLPKDTAMTEVFEDSLLNGVEVIRGHAKQVVDADASHDKDVQFTAVPYFAWDNREPGEMAVWLAEDRGIVKPTTSPVTEAK